MNIFGVDRNGNFDVKNVATPKWRWMATSGLECTGMAEYLITTKKWYASKEEAEYDTGCKIIAPIESTRIDE